MFKWSELNGITAVLQSHRVGIHPLSPQLPRRVLTLHLTPSNQQLNPLQRKRNLCSISTCPVYVRKKSLLVFNIAGTFDSDSHPVFLVQLNCLNAFFVGIFEGYYYTEG